MVEEILTPADSMLEFLQKNKKANFKQLTDYLHLKSDEVEKIARILEESGIVEINYPLIGEPIVSLREKLTKKIEEEKKKVESERIAVVERAKEIKKQAKIISEKISLLEGIANQIELADSLFLTLEELSFDEKGIKQQLKLKLDKNKKRELTKKIKEFDASKEELALTIKKLEKSLESFYNERKIIDGAVDTLARNVKILGKKINLLRKKVT